MSLLDTASLIVTPNGYKEGKLYSVIPSDGSGDMSVTRATTATRVNSAGLVELVPYNLLSWSEDLTQWTANIQIASTQLVLNPLTGVNNATKITKVSGASDPWVRQIVSAGNGTYTYSLYLWTDAGQQTDIEIYMYNASISEVYTLSITLTTTPTRYEFDATFANTGGNITARIDLVNTGDQYIYAYAAQLVEGTTAKDYQKTETRLNIPRLDYSNGTCPSLLVEPQRTNLVTYSSSFDNAAWTKLNGSVTSNSTTSPSGIQDADSFIPNTTSGVHALRSNNFNQSSTASHSWFLKANGYSKIAVRESDLVGNYASFDLSNGTLISTNQTGSIESYGNGWYRCTLVDTTTGAGAQTSITVLPDSYTTGDPLIAWSGDGIKGVFAYGAQVELGSYATSYIPTTSASVTRNADVISKTGISSLIGQTEGTIFCELDRIEGAENMGIWMRTGASAYNEMIAILINPDGTSVASIRSSATNQFVASGSALSSGKHKFALAYKANDFAFYIDGVQIATSTSGTPPTCDQVYLGGYPDGGARASKNVATALWKTRLTNTQLAQLTSI
jgi:hypothetical protein